MDLDGRLEEDSAVGLNFERSINCSDACWFFWGVEGWWFCVLVAEPVWEPLKLLLKYNNGK